MEVYAMSPLKCRFWIPIVVVFFAILLGSNMAYEDPLAWVLLLLAFVAFCLQLLMILGWGLGTFVNWLKK